jgi:hypothetical protein
VGTTRQDCRSGGEAEESSFSEEKEAKRLYPFDGHAARFFD